MPPKENEPEMTCDAPHLHTRLGLGAMRLSDETTVDPGEVLGRAIDCGTMFFDTADVYGPDAKSQHHNEALIASALAGFDPSARAEIIVATKAGLTRKGTRWMPDGDPKSITRKANRSLKALGVKHIDLFQLHVRDPRVPFEDTLGAMSDLYQAGKVRSLGLCNTTFGNVAAALSVLPAGSLAAIQNPLSPLNAADATEAMALLPLCRALGLSFIAHSPLGGRKKSSTLGAHKQIARIHGLLLAAEPAAPGPHAMVLAWLMSLSPEIVVIPGATRGETVGSNARALTYPWPAATIDALDAAFPAFAALRTAALARPITNLQDAITAATTFTPLPAPEEAEVVITVGIQGSGKSSAIAPYVDAGHLRLNRDERGGKLIDLIAPLATHLKDKKSAAILDNTYATAAARAPVIAAAQAAGVPVRALWLDTSLADARINVVKRMLELTGQLCGPDELKALGKEHANLIPPAAHQMFVGLFEPPTMLEGLNAVERRPFVRRASGHTTRGLLLDVDGTLRLTRSGEKYPKAVDDFEIQPGRVDVLRGWVDGGWRLFFVSNQSGIASGKVEAAVVQAAMENTAAALGVPIDAIIYCPHPAFPVGCFCRKPMPGMGVKLMEDHGLDPKNLVMVGDMKSDAAFAESIGARYFDAEDFFGPAGPDPKSA